MSFIYPLRHLHSDIWPSPPTFTEKDYPDQTGKTFLITGTSAGIGKEATKLLLSKNAIVIAVNRDKNKTILATEEIVNDTLKLNSTLNKATVESRLINVFADLSDLSTIKPATAEIFQCTNELDTVILNAGVMDPPDGSLTKQGYELQFGVNVIAHQLLLDQVQPLISNSIKKGTTPRVLFISSSSHGYAPAHGGLTWKFKECPVKGHALYGQSKVGNIYQASEYGKNHPDCVSLSVHPGWLTSELKRYQPGWVSSFVNNRVKHPAVFGAYTELWAAMSPEITTKDNGKFAAPWGRFRDLRDDIDAGRDDGTAEKMLKWVESEIESYK